MSANNLTATKNELISSLAQRELLESAPLAQFMGNYSNLAGKGVKEIQLPKFSSFTVQDRAFGAAATENSPLTDSVDSIPLDKNKIILFGYDAADEIQSSVDYMTLAISRAAAAHGRQINSDILAEWTSVAGLSVNGGTPADITADDILDMREFLMSNFADMSKSWLIISADQEKAMLKLAEFSQYQYRGGAESPIVNGQIGFVYGVPVVINQQVGSQQAFMVNMEGSGIAIQRQPKVKEQDDVSYGTDGKKVAIDVLYGVGGLQLGEGSAASGKSPLIAKLKD